MVAAFLLPEIELTAPGTGPHLDLGPQPASPLLLTLGILRVREQQSLDLSIEGSETGSDWLPKPLLQFPQKYYPGTYQVLLDLREQAAIRFIRAKWTLNRWGRGEMNPIFSIFLFVENPKTPA